MRLRTKPIIIAILTGMALSLFTAIPSHAAVTCSAQQVGAAPGANQFSTSAQLQTWLNSAATNCPNAGDSVVVNFMASTLSITSTLTWSGNADLSFVGTSYSASILDGGSARMILNSQSSGLLKFQNIALQNGYTTGSGGAGAYHAGDVIVTSSKFNNNAITRAFNTSNSNGGAAINALGSVTVTNSIFANNVVTNNGTYAYGGAINADSITTSGSTFTSNSVLNSGRGGAVFARGAGGISATSTEFSYNSAPYGGAIASRVGAINIGAVSVFTSNTAGTDGGAIYLDGPAATFENFTASGNSAAGKGGFIAASSSTVTMNSAVGGSTMTNNGSTTQASAGAIAAGTLVLNGSSGKAIQFTGNKALLGGAVVSSNITGTYVIFNANQAGTTSVQGLGGAIYSEFDGTMNFSQAQFTGNKAQFGTGAAIYGVNVYDLTSNTGLNVTLDATTFGGNLSKSSALTVDVTRFDPSYTSFTSSIPTTGGVVVDGNVTATNSTFSGNTGAIANLTTFDPASGGGNITLTFVTLGSGTGDALSTGGSGVLTSTATAIAGACQTTSPVSTYSYSTNANCGGTVAANLNLATLTNNGGFGNTLLPNAGSVLIGGVPAGAVTSPTTDQTGATRTGLNTVGAVYVSAPTYTVSFDVQGGSSTGSQTIAQGASVTLPAAPTFSGHTFNGWFSAATGGTLIGAASASYTPTGDVTLFAQWTADSSGGGSGGSGSNGNLPYTGNQAGQILGISGALLSIGLAVTAFAMYRRRKG